MRSTNLATLTFAEAASAWLKTREGHLSPRTFVDYGNYIKTLNAFFAEMRLSEIDGDQIRAYQHSRMQRAGPTIINHECMILLQMRKRIGDPVSDYQRLKMPKDWESPGRRLTNEEEKRLEKVFHAAAEVPRWAVAALTSLLSMKCGAGPGEIRSLRLKDCSLDPPQITIPARGAKNARRARLIVLNDTATWALEKLIDRAIDVCGSRSEEDFLIPFRNLDHGFDPSRSCSDDGWRTALRHLLGLAEVDVRNYDFRHHAVSVAIGNPKVTRQGARAYFGWISDKMFMRYGHAELAELKVVAAAMDVKKPVQAEDFDPRKRLKRRQQ